MLVWTEIACTEHVALAKLPISQLKPVQQSRQQALRAHCPKYILCASVPIVLHLCLIEDVKAKMDPFQRKSI